MITVGLVGLGSMGANHLRVLSQLDVVDQVLIYDPRENLAIPRFGTVVPTMEHIISAAPNYCVVSSPSTHHLESSRPLVEANIPTLIEKPLAGSLNDAVDLHNLITLNENYLSAIGHVERFNPAVNELRHRINEDAIGQVLAVSSSRRGPQPSRWIDTGVAADLAVHDIDLTRWITGSDYQQISAIGVQGVENPREELVRISALLSNGVAVDHAVDWMTPVKMREITVLGTDGMLTANLLTADLTFFGKGERDTRWPQMAQLRGNTEGVVTRYALNKQEPLRAEHEAMINFVQGGDRGNLASSEDALRALEAVDIVLKSI